MKSNDIGIFLSANYGFFYHKPFEKYKNVDHLIGCVANVQLFVHMTPNVTQLLVRKLSCPTAIGRDTVRHIHPVQ